MSSDADRPILSGTQCVFTEAGMCMILEGIYDFTIAPFDVIYLKIPCTQLSLGFSAAMLMC